MFKVHKTITINPKLQEEAKEFLRSEGLNFSAWVEQVLEEALVAYRIKNKTRLKIKQDFSAEYTDTQLPITDLYDYTSYENPNQSTKKAGIRAPNSIRTEF
jgi:macrodomain Ter protein organizer (MatP/YcbG family)